MNRRERRAQLKDEQRRLEIQAEIWRAEDEDPGTGLEVFRTHYDELRDLMNRQKAQS